MLELMKLPLEVRRFVYRGLVVIDGHCNISLLGSDIRHRTGTVPNHARTTKPPEKLHLSILQVSKTVYEEAVDVLYRENEFDLSFYFGSQGNSVASVDALFRRLGRDNARKIRHVCWNESFVAVSWGVNRGVETLLVHRQILDMVRRILRHLPHLRASEIWCTRNGSRRLPGDAVQALPTEGPVEWDCLYNVAFVAGMKGTASERCSWYWKTG
ncbi:hypothetical protein G3M48_007867 [Beauveria asiatica]|uniref:DUF7730 domain-containing protein n=1 Tax=Beauveria asiatica TaxID=1069075 RepID=A0AAW0S481_9HYPO